VAAAIASARWAGRLRRGGRVVDPGQQVPHHLDQAVAGDRGDHRRRVVLGDSEEERVLVPEVVEDRAAGQPGRLLQPADRGTLVAVPGEACAGGGEDLAPPRVELVLAHSGHM
jgi:hypothetical protein